MVAITQRAMRAARGIMERNEVHHDEVMRLLKTVYDNAKATYEARAK